MKVVYDKVEYSFDFLSFVLIKNAKRHPVTSLGICVITVNVLTFTLNSRVRIHHGNNIYVEKVFLIIRKCYLNSRDFNF